jgi:lipoprotein NlpI
LADFCKSIAAETSDWNVWAPYAHFRVWLVSTRQGKSELATAELQSYLHGRHSRKPDDWPSKIGHLLAGELAEPELLGAAKNANPITEGQQLCEAYFYVGAKHLFAGDKVTATDYFQKSIATDKKTCPECTSAAAELKFLTAQKN